MSDPEPVPEMVERICRAMCCPPGECQYPEEAHCSMALWSQAQVYLAIETMRPMSKAMSRAAVRGRDGHHVIGDPDVVWNCILDAMLETPDAGQG